LSRLHSVAGQLPVKKRTTSQRNSVKAYVFGGNCTIEGPVNVQLFNTSGQLAKQVAVKITKGYNQVKIAINDIKEGMYLLRINKGDLSIIRKFVIAR